MVDLVETIGVISETAVFRPGHMQAVAKHHFKQALAPLPKEVRATAAWAVDFKDQGSVLILGVQVQSRLLDIRQPRGPQALRALVESGVYTPYMGLEGTSWSLWNRNIRVRKAVSLSKYRPGSVEVLVAELDDWSFTRCELRAVGFDYVELRRAVFEDCDLRGASFVGAELEGAVFRNCRLDAATFEEANLEGAAFENCSINHARFERASIDETTSFQGCTWKRVSPIIADRWKPADDDAAAQAV